MRTAFFSILLLLACSSCQRHVEERKEITELQALLVEAEGTLEAWDTKAFEAQRVGVSERLDTVTRIFAATGDVMSEEQADLMMDLRGSGRIFKKFGPVYQRIRYALNQGETQLTALDHDLEHGLVPKDSVQFHMDAETKAIRDLHAEILRYDTLIIASMEKYERFKPQVDSLIESLNAAAE